MSISTTTIVSHHSTHTVTSDVHELQYPRIEGAQHTDLQNFVESPDLQPTNSAVSYPEGTMSGWIVVMGSLCITFSAWGLVTCVGVLQAFWETHQLSSYSSSSISWISSLNTFLALSLGSHAGALFDCYGPRWLLFAGSIGYVLSIFLLGECKEYWHFMLVYGVLAGVSRAFCTTIAVSVIAHWFKDKRGQASGFVFIGTSLGGVIYPLILQPMFDRLGWAWAMRILAFINLVLIAVGNVCIKPRLPRVKRNAKVYDLGLYQDSRFAWSSFGIATFEFVYVGVVGILPTYAVTAGFSVSTSFIVVSVMNGGSTFGRLAAGMFADRLGKFNSMLFTLLLSILPALCFWVPLSSTASSATTISSALLYTFASTFGFGAGSIISLAPVCFGELCEISDYGKYYGTGYSLVGVFALVSIPIGGALLGSAGERGLVGFFTGVLGISLICFICARWAVLEWKWRWRVKV